MQYSLETTEIEIVINGTPHPLDLLECEIFLEGNVDGKPAVEFVPTVQGFLRNKIGVDVSFSQAMKFADHIRLAYHEFKKKYEDGLKSDFPLAATLLASLNENTSSSETNSPDFVP